MFRFLLLSVTLLFCILISDRAPAHEYDYAGSISLGDGLFGAGNWNNGPTTLSWTAFHSEFALETNYSYTFDHPATETFEFIFEVHEAMKPDSIYDVFSTLPNFEIGLFDPASHPGIPEAVYGYRFWGNSGSNTDTISFKSYFPVMWGDFYSGGVDPMDYAWNEGFTHPDQKFPERGTGPSGNGSLNGHILVPGGNGIPIIPEPNFSSYLFVMLLLLVRNRCAKVNRKST